LADERFRFSEIWHIVTCQGPQLLHLFDVGALHWDAVAEHYNPQAPCGVFLRGISEEHKHNIFSELDYKCPICVEYDK